MTTPLHIPWKHLIIARWRRAVCRQTLHVYWFLVNLEILKLLSITPSVDLCIHNSPFIFYIHCTSLSIRVVILVYLVNWISEYQKYDNLVCFPRQQTDQICHLGLDFISLLQNDAWVNCVHLILFCNFVWNFNHILFLCWISTTYFYICITYSIKVSRSKFRIYTRTF